jgi:uncharacterized protein YecT (DUF1311 family)
MKQNLLLITFFFSSLFALAQTQQEMNTDAAQKYKLSDKELNLVYQKILLEYKSDSEFIKKLKVTQNLWIKFRDAEVVARFPNKEPNYYGSFHSVCHYDYLAELTDKRINDLKVWIIGMQEGNVCSGSVKVKD